MNTILGVGSPRERMNYSTSYGTTSEQKMIQPLSNGENVSTLDRYAKHAIVCFVATETDTSVRLVHFYALVLRH